MIAFRLHARLCLMLTAACWAASAVNAQAEVFRFDTDPFAGSSALDTPGRQVVANELFIPEFDLDTDTIQLDASVFGIDPEVKAFSGQASALPDQRLNVIILHDVDFDGVEANGLSLNAIGAADLIAARISEPGAGFFVYFNTNLNLNRLVYSTDLSSPTADLKIMARFLDQAGQAGVEALDDWGGAQFSTAVPEPATWTMLMAGFGLLGGALRRRTSAVAAT